MKAYIHYEDGKLATSLRDHKPKDMVCLCPKDESGEWVIDLDVLVISEDQATIDKDKLAAKKELLDSKEAAKKAKSQEKASEFLQLKEIDWSEAGINELRQFAAHYFKQG